MSTGKTSRKQSSTDSTGESQSPTFVADTANTTGRRKAAFVFIGDVLTK